MLVVEFFCYSRVDLETSMVCEAEYSIAAAQRSSVSPRSSEMQNWVKKSSIFFWKRRRLMWMNWSSEGGNELVTAAPRSSGPPRSSSSAGQVNR